MNWPDQGIHLGVPFNIYRADDIQKTDTIETVGGKAVSKSLLVNFMEDAWAWRNAPPKKVTQAMSKGSLFDTLLTEPDKLDLRFAVSEYDSFRTNAAKEWRDRMEESGICVITADHLEFAQLQVAAVMAKPEAAALINGSRMQAAFRHATPYTFDAKGLVDIVPDDDTMLVDLKTCESGALESHRSLQRHIFEWGYHIQAGAYLDGWNIAAGEDRTRFKFIFVSSAAPIRVAVVELPLAAILLGAEQYVSAMRRFAQCLESNAWPSIWDGEIELDLPTYAYTES